MQRPAYNRLISTDALLPTVQQLPPEATPHQYQHAGQMPALCWATRTLMQHQMRKDGASVGVPALALHQQYGASCQQ
jgi:hypothetical protein